MSGHDHHGHRCHGHHSDGNNQNRKRKSKTSQNSKPSQESGGGSSYASSEFPPVIKNFYFGKDDGEFYPQSPALANLGERVHFAEVCYSCLNYEEDCIEELEEISEEKKIPPELAAMLVLDPNLYTEEISQMLETNQMLLDNVVMFKEHQGELPPGFTEYGVPPWAELTETNSSKTRSTLRQIVRDWSVEGEAERDGQFKLMLDTLEKYLPITDAIRRGEEAPPKVLCPGCGLGRLPYDAVCRGYTAQGNEFSNQMLFVSDFILNAINQQDQYTIYPYVTSHKNRVGSRDHLRKVSIPDVEPGRNLMEKKTPLSQFSMTCGEFVGVYESQVGEWDALLTCFFIDTAKNFLLYVRTFAAIIPEDGIWINFGPLLWHFSQQDDETSIELSWEQCKKIISEYFIIVQEDTACEAVYVDDALSTERTIFECVLMVGKRNKTPVTGKSHPVYNDEPEEEGEGSGHTGCGEPGHTHGPRPPRPRRDHEHGHSHEHSHGGHVCQGHH